MESMTKEQFSANFGIDSEGSRIKLLDAIDKVRDLRVRGISLPQIVALGDQNCGKSSLLESISGISFPVNDGLCTRFVIRIALRHTSKPAAVHASIKPGPTSEKSSAVCERLKGFQHEFKVSEFGPDQFQDIIDKATEFMGIGGASGSRRGSSESKRGKRFSDDILEIKVSANYLPHLNIVDVPGLFSNPNMSQTEEDQKLVEDMIKSYIREPETIIMAVMSAMTDLINQHIFNLARGQGGSGDPQGIRTVGVITKCDLLKEGSEDRVLQIVANKDNELRHGFFVVKNRSKDDVENLVTPEERQKSEISFFSEERWNSIDRERVGVQKLNVFLTELLHERIRSELPKIVQNINHVMADSQRKLSGLGDVRKDSNSQRFYLTVIAMNYKDKVKVWLDGIGESNVELSHPARILTHIYTLIKRFRTTMKENGPSRPFKGPDRNEEDNTSGSDGDKGKNAEVAPGDIYSLIREEIDRSPARLLPGKTNSVVAEKLFQELAKDWRRCAEAHVEDAIEAIEKFHSEILKQVTPDEAVRTRLDLSMGVEMCRKFEVARTELEKIINDELSGSLNTDDERFLEKVTLAKRKRIQLNLARNNKSDMWMSPTSSQALVEVLFEVLTNSNVVTGTIFKVLKLANLPGDEADTLTQAGLISQIIKEALPKFYGVSETANALTIGPDAAVEEIHDDLEAYYPIALERFIANVNNQVIFRELLGENGPLSLLDPKYISQLSTEQLQDIVKEDNNTAIQRNKLELDLKRASEAKAILESII
ncbi:hypothetical protein H072_508 [Dactylellina haptotyla CBS 200.50]|uniref:GED domain-containing protein n=1 Tax=Dactylellina haptotyla (strain CBS 200.50) TaxID=1284197 RepID=S8AWX9_DACHA|nr:hypothetical protein H072_508 [Dactylellina haptotyla CBS 200.50]